MVAGDWDGDRCGRKVFGCGGEGDVAVGCGGAEDSEGVAFVEFAIGCLEGVVVEEVAVIDCDDL